MKTDESIPTHSRLPHGIVLALSAVAAVVIARSGPAPAPEPAEPKPAPYQILAYLDNRVGVQENQKDVRCWSSCNKFLMFATNSEISQEAKTARIQQHMGLIQSLYDATAQRVPGNKLIPAAAVKAELGERFPRKDTAEGTHFTFGGSSLLMVDSEVLKDYSDTIEPWRLLQTWASHQIDAQGAWQLEAQFDVEALKELYEFFKRFDLTMLRQARDNAMERKLNHIDAQAIKAAFKVVGIQ